MKARITRAVMWGDMQTVRQLIADVQARVKEKFGVELEPEVKMWGF